MAIILQIKSSLDYQLARGMIMLTSLLMLSACSIDTNQLSSENASPASDQIPSTSTISPEPSATPLTLNITTPTPTLIPETTQIPESNVYTPDFSVPPSSEKPLTAWRPPVYPVPWEPSPYDHFYFANPIGAYEIDAYITTYGYGDVFFENVVHTGIDIPGDIGIPILAAGDGKVVYVGYGVYRGGEDVYDDPYGNAIAIEHSFGYQGEKLYTLYAHLDEILVSNNQMVKTGDQIGLMGKTGRTTGPHLHFEVRVGNNEYFSTRNPDLWISPPQGWGVLVGQIHTYEGRLLQQQTVYLYRLDSPESEDEDAQRLWIGKSYQYEAINRDPYYKENLTIANLPAGKYLVYIPVTSIGLSYQKEIDIHPGQVTFIKFNLWRGFSPGLPPTPEYNFSPSP